MASALHMSVTVEGVEQQQQVDALRSRFAGSIQGYFYSRPKPADEIAEQIASLGLRDAEPLLPAARNRPAKATMPG